MKTAEFEVKVEKLPADKNLVRCTGCDYARLPKDWRQMYRVTFARGPWQIAEMIWCSRCYEIARKEIR